jgi:hypothetical protein
MATRTKPKRVGRRSKQAKKKSTPKWKVNDRVRVVFDVTDKNGDTHSNSHFGSIDAMGEQDGKCVVTFDDGDVLEVQMSMLHPPNSSPEYLGDADGHPIRPSLRVRRGQEGFAQYGIEWQNIEREPLNFVKNPKHKPEHAHYFRAAFNGPYGTISFAGELLRTANAHNIDMAVMYAAIMYAKFNGAVFAMKTIDWGTDDPRQPQPNCDKHSGINEMNKDICAAMNKWMWRHISGDVPTISDYVSMARHPIMVYSTLDKLDADITALQQVRSLAMNSGGTYQATINGDGVPKQWRGPAPKLTVVCDFTTQAIIAEGKAPPIRGGGILDSAGKSGGKRRGRKPSSIPAPSGVDMTNVEQMRAEIERLNTLHRETGDPNAKSAARRLRGELRKLGVKGGARGNKNGKRK